MKRILSLVAVAAAGSVALSWAPASAQECPYPAGCPTASVSDRTAAQGQVVRFSGSNWRPFSPITIRLAGKTIARTMANAAGSFGTNARIPRRAPLGRHDILIRGRDVGGAHTTVAIRVWILPAGAGAGAGGGAGPAMGAAGGPGEAAGGRVALTGAGLWGALLLVSVLAVAGVGALGAARRRRDRTWAGRV